MYTQHTRTHTTHTHTVHTHPHTHLQADEGKPQGSRAIAAGHLTNLARNSSGLVWGLDQLKDVLGDAAYTGAERPAEFKLDISGEASWF
jgi:hypothetical protein